VTVRLLAVCLLACAVVLFAAAAAARVIGSGATSDRIACGVQRWTVKTLQDRL
jgi:hypothetical protein